MKILYCNKYNFIFSGTEVYLFGLMELMRAHGHETALFSMQDERGLPTQYDRHLLPHLDFKGSQHSLCERAHLAAHAVYSPGARTRLRKLTHEFRPDVAHVRNIYHHLSPSILWELKAQGIPVVYHLNDFKLLCPSYNMVSGGRACERCRGGQFWHMLVEGCYHGGRASAAVLAAEAYFHKWLQTYEKCIDLYLAPSRFVRDKLLENGWDARKITVLPHFQKLSQEVPAALVENPPILYFGRLSAEKGLTDLLRAMCRVPRIPLRIAGDGPQRSQLEELVRKLGLKNVEFVGHLLSQELERSIAEAAFTVLPSRAYETLGKAILESYAVGRPVVASDLGSRPELVVEGKTGLLFRPGDVGQLAGAISFLYDRPQLAIQMGAAGRELVRTRHTPEAHYESVLRLYEELARDHGTRTLFSTGPKPRLHVAFIGGRGVASKYSGIEAYYEEVGKRLAAMGHDVTVYCRNYFTPASEQHNGMRLVRLPTIRSKHLETVVHTFLSTAHVLFRRCDIVHYHALGPALFSFAPRLIDKKTVVTVQGLDWQRKKWGSMASAVLHLGEQAAIRLPNMTMVVSRTLQEYYRDRHSAETVYVPNGSVTHARRQPGIILQWGLEPDQYILFLGRFSPEKNCHLLIEAYERIETSVKLVMAGGDSYTGDYSRELRKHASERVRLLDWVSGDALEELLTNAMLFVLPSDLEGLSLALLDAMGAGICVLTSDIPENCELVEGAGFTFRRRDVADLERMLRLLISDSRVREEAGARAQAKIRAHYLWPRIATEIERAYLQLVGWREASAMPPLSAVAEASPQHESVSR